MLEAVVAAFLLAQVGKAVKGREVDPTGRLVNKGAFVGVDWRVGSGGWPG